MGAGVLESIREDLRNTLLHRHDAEGTPFWCVTGSELFDDTARFAERLVEHTGELVEHVNERGFENVFATVEHLRRTAEAISAVAFNAADRRGVFETDGHRSAQAFLTASVNLSDRERTERLQVAGLVELVPRVADLLADATLPVAHAVTLGRLVANDRIDREQLVAALSGFLLFGPQLPHHVFARRVSSWARHIDRDGTRRDSERAHGERDVRLTEVLGGFVLNGRFGAVQGAKVSAILDAFIDIEFDRDWQTARLIHGDQTSVDKLARTHEQRRADAFEAIMLAAIGQGTAKDVDIIINIVVDHDTFTTAAAEAAAAASGTDTHTTHTHVPAHAASDTTDADAPADADSSDRDTTHTNTDTGMPVDDDTTDVQPDTSDSADTTDTTDTTDSADVPADDDTTDTDVPADAGNGEMIATEIRPNTATSDTATSDTNDRADDSGAAETTDANSDGHGDDAGSLVESRDRHFCHTLHGVHIDPLDAVQAAIDGHIRAVIVDGGVIINQGRKQRLFRGNTRIAAQLQAGIDHLHRCPFPGCRAHPKHVDHATEWASPDAGRTDVDNSNLPCTHHNLWKTKHHYTVRRDEHGTLRTYRPDGTELRPY